MLTWMARAATYLLDFSNTLNTSISAGWLVLAVLILRLVLKKAPKQALVILWGLVALRLLLPVLPESPFSLLPSAEPIPQELLGFEGTQLQASARLNLVTNQLYQKNISVPIPYSVDSFQWKMLWSLFIWFPGMVVMTGYALISCLLLRRKIRTAVRLEGNLFQCEFISTPFVFGLLHPKIYLPASVYREDLAQILAHERAHIRRKDPWWKALGYLLLTIHWFNPLMWLSYLLFCRDLELACDETVIQTLQSDQRADYSQALLNCGAKAHISRTCPLAFGEISVKSRITAVLGYKKPGTAQTVAAALACLLTVLCFLTNPIPSIRNPWTQEYLPGQSNILGSVDTADYLQRSPDFAIGADRYGRAVFKDPNRAFDTFTKLYAEGIDLIQTQHKLTPLTRTDFDLYKVFGWQTTTGSEEARTQAGFVSKFLDIYENSFSLEQPDLRQAEPTKEAPES